MPRELLASDPEICHRMSFANLLTSIAFLHSSYSRGKEEAWVVPRLVVIVAQY